MRIATDSTTLCATAVFASREHFAPVATGRPGYASWHSENVRFATDLSSEHDICTADVGGYLSQGPARRGPNVHDVHSVAHVHGTSSVLLRTNSGQQLPAARSFLTPAYKVDGWTCRQQVIVDEHRGEVWSLTCGTGFASGGVWRWSLIPGSLVMRLEIWRNPYEGGLSWYMDNGVPTRDLGNVKLTIPAKQEALDALVKDRSVWYEKGGFTAPQSFTRTFVDPELDFEVLANAYTPYLLRLREVYAPSVYRDALNKFKKYDSNILVEMLDTFGTLGSFKELLPGQALKDIVSAGRRFKNRCFYKNGAWWEITKRGIQKLSRKRLEKIGISRESLLSAIAASRLEYQYGVNLPLQTVRNFWSADTTEPWALAIQTAWDAGAAKRLEERLYQRILRSRLAVDDRTTVSVSIELDLAPQDMFIEYYQGLYSSGLLMTMSGVWDLFPLSFAADWVTGGIKHFMEVLDATTVEQMLKIVQTCKTIKHTETSEITIDNMTFTIDLTAYLRDYVSGGLPNIGMRIQDFLPGFSAKFLPEASSLIYLLKH